jgi:hypothetical protein
MHCCARFPSVLNIIKSASDALEASAHPSLSIQYACLHNVVSYLQKRRIDLTKLDFKNSASVLQTPEAIKPSRAHSIKSQAFDYKRDASIDIKATLVELIDTIVSGIKERFGFTHASVDPSASDSTARTESMHLPAAAFLLDPAAACSRVPARALQYAHRALKFECMRRGACKTAAESGATEEDDD